MSTPTPVDPHTTLEPLRDQHTVVITTFRRDGTAVATPVSLAVDDDPSHGYMRTWSTAGKAKRIGNDPHVTIAPSTFRGTVTGQVVPAEARLVHGDEDDHARRLLRRKHPVLHGILVPIAHALQRSETQHYEIVVQRRRDRGRDSSSE